jgi:hypothetical protein
MMTLKIKGTFEHTTLTFLYFCTKLQKMNVLSNKMLKEAGNENETLLVKFSDLHALVDALKSDNSMHLDKVKFLENEVIDYKNLYLLNYLIHISCMGS